MSETAHRPVSQNGSGPSSASPNGTVASGAGGPGSTGGSGGSSGLLDNPWFTRIASIVVLALAAGIFAYGCNVGQSADDADSNSAIVERYPAPGGRALRQTEVGALLDMGYDGRLVVNGVEIPEEQMEGAVDPSTLTPDQLRQYGVRPNNRHRVVFRPGPGKVIEEFERGEVTITLRYFLDRREETGSRTTTWTVTVT